MKTKKFSKRLALKKETISTLNGSALEKVKGGCGQTDCMSCAHSIGVCPSDPIPSEPPC